MRIASRLRVPSRGLAIALAPALALLATSCGDDGIFVITPHDFSMPPPQPDLTVAVPPDMTVLPDLTIPPDLTELHDFGGVLCGAMTCAQGLQCCATVDVNGMMLTQSCEQSCNSDAGMFVQACDGPEDCMGNPCCVKGAIGGGG